MFMASSLGHLPLGQIQLRGGIRRVWFGGVWSSPSSSASASLASLASLTSCSCASSCASSSSACFFRFQTDLFHRSHLSAPRLRSFDLACSFTTNTNTLHTSVAAAGAANGSSQPVLRGFDIVANQPSTYAPNVVVEAYAGAAEAAKPTENTNNQGNGATSTTTITTRRGPTAVNLTLSELAKLVPRCSVRDLRLLRSRGSTIAVHRTFIAFKVDPPSISGMVSRDRLILTDTGASARSFIESLSRALTHSKDAPAPCDDGKPPLFTMRVIEAVLEESCVSLERSYRRLEVLIDNLLPKLTRQGVTDQMNWLPWVGSANDAKREEGFSRLLTLTKSLSDVKSRTVRLVEILKEVLAEPQDLEELEYLCAPDHIAMSHRLWQEQYRTQTSGGIHPVASSESTAADCEDPSVHEYFERDYGGVAELMLEAYESRLQNLEDDCDKLEGKIAQTRQTIELSLANESNRIRRLELHIANAALCVGSMACVYSLFGTNVPNGFEESSTAFVTLAGSAMFAGAMASGPFLLSYRSFFGGDVRRSDDELALTTALRGIEEVQNAIRGDVAFSKRLRKAVEGATSAHHSKNSHNPAIASSRPPWGMGMLRRNAESSGGGRIPDELVLETLARTYGSRMRRLRPREIEMWREMLQVEYKKMHRMDQHHDEDVGSWIHVDEREPTTLPRLTKSNTMPESPAIFKRSNSSRKIDQL